MSMTQPDFRYYNTIDQIYHAEWATPKLAKYNVHTQFDRDTSPSQYYFRAFFITLTGGTLLPLMGIMFLDLVRRLFPGKKFKRRK